MASFEKVKDVYGWLANRETFESRATKSKVDPLEWLFDLKYKIPRVGFLVSKNRIVDSVEDGYFYFVAFACGLRFPLSDFMVEVLEAYSCCAFTVTSELLEDNEILLSRLLRR